MPLYKYEQDGKTLKKIDRRKFSNEAELHSLIEANLLLILRIKLIASEYPIPNGRIDTLGIDEDGIPVIIEYKWSKDLSAIIQGLFYLDWVMQNKKPFESIVKDKLGKDENVNWETQPRLLIIAQDYDIKELSAINQMGPQIELLKYSLYEGLFGVENVNIIKGKTKPRTTPNGTDVKEYSINNLVNRTTPEVEEIFYRLRERILGFSESVWEKVCSSYVDYRTITTFTTIHIQKNRLKIFIKMGDKKINDPRGLCSEIPENWGYGHLNTQFFIDNSSDLDYAFSLIEQAFEYVSG